MRIAEINADEELRDILTGKVTVDSAGTQVHVYRSGELPTSGYPSDFIEIEYNGSFRAKATPLDVISGVILVSYCCKLQPDGSIKFNRIKKVLSQFEDYVNANSSEHYFYELDNTGFVTPPTASQSTGYSVVRLNVKWHTK